MRSETIFVLGLLATCGLASPASPLNERAACAADNCLNAVRKPTSVNTKDCQSFMTRTVTPCPVTTVTATRTSTVTSSIGSAAPKAKRDLEQELQELQERQVTTCPTTPDNTATPTYATPCSGTVRYSSACSCLGVTTGITTAPSPTATAYVTTTTTTTVTAVYSTFKAKATSGPLAGQWVVRGKTNTPNAIDPSSVMGFTSDPALAETFAIIANGSIYGMGGSQNPNFIWRKTRGISYIREEAYNDDVEPVVKCSLTALSLAGNAAINCYSIAESSPSYWQTCDTTHKTLDLGTYVYPGTEGPADQCYALDLVSVPVV